MKVTTPANKGEVWSFLVQRPSTLCQKTSIREGLMDSSCEPWGEETVNVEEENVGVQATLKLGIRRKKFDTGEIDAFVWWPGEEPEEPKELRVTPAPDQRASEVCVNEPSWYLSPAVARSACVCIWPPWYARKSPSVWLLLEDPSC